MHHISSQINQMTGVCHVCLCPLTKEVHVDLLQPPERTEQGHVRASPVKFHGSCRAVSLPQGFRDACEDPRPQPNLLTTSSPTDEPTREKQSN